MTPEEHMREFEWWGRGLAPIYWDKANWLQCPVCSADKRALAQEEKPYQDPIFHLDPSTNVVTALPAEIGEALRLADELSLWVLESKQNVGNPIKGKAREYRKARGLESLLRIPSRK